MSMPSPSSVPSPSSEVWRGVSPKDQVVRRSANTDELKPQLVRAIDEDGAVAQAKPSDDEVRTTNRMRASTKLHNPSVFGARSTNPTTSSSTTTTRAHSSISTRFELERVLKTTQRSIMDAAQSREFALARQKTNEYSELIELRKQLPTIPEIESKIELLEEQFNNYIDQHRIDDAELIDNEMKQLQKQLSLERKADRSVNIVTPASITTATIPAEDEAESEIDDYSDKDIVPQSKFRSRSYGINGSGGLLSEIGDNSSQEEGPYDRLVVLQGAPLVWSDNVGNYQTLPLPDFDTEKKVILEAMNDAKEMTGAEVDVVFETATTDRLGAFLETGGSPVLHFSCHGHPRYLAIENGWGALQSLLVSDLHEFVSRGSGILKVVFISACHSGPAGEAFLKAGVEHVVCCDQNERLRDTAAIEFAKHFYRSLACGKRLRESFELACQAVKISPNVTDPSVEMKKFRLLPEKPDGDPYHDVPVFFNGPKRPRIAKRQASFSEDWILPPPPQIFLGRELAMYRVLEKLRAARLVQIAGVKDIGKSSLTKAVCKYIQSRMRSFRLDDIAWLPPLQNTPFEDHVSCTLRDVFDGITDDEVPVTQISQYLGRIVKKIRDRFVLIAIDGREMFSGSRMEKLNIFLQGLFDNTFNTKVILVCPSAQEFNSSGRRYVGLTAIVDPLQFRYSALLFGKLCAFHLRGCHVATNAEELAELLVPKAHEQATELSKTMSKRCTDIFSFVGKGIPGQVHVRATNITKEDFDKLIRVAMRPEFDSQVNCRVELENELKRVSKKIATAVSNQDFLKAQEFKDAKEELVRLRQNFPTLPELKSVEATTKADLDEAIGSQQFLKADELKKQLEDLRTKIKNEEEARYDDEEEDEEEEEEEEANPSDGDDKSDEKKGSDDEGAGGNGDFGGDGGNYRGRNAGADGGDGKGKGNEGSGGRDNDNKKDNINRPPEGNRDGNKGAREAADDNDDDSRGSNDNTEGQSPTTASDSKRSELIRRLQEENVALKQQVEQLEGRISNYQAHVNRLEFTIAGLQKVSIPGGESIIEENSASRRSVLSQLREEESIPSIDMTEDSSQSSGSRYWQEKFGAGKVAPFLPKEAPIQERTSTQNTDSTHQNLSMLRSHGTNTSASNQLQQETSAPRRTSAQRTHYSTQADDASLLNSSLHRSQGTKTLPVQPQSQSQSWDQLPTMPMPHLRMDRRATSDSFQSPVDAFKTDSIDEIIRGAAAVYGSSTTETFSSSTPSVIDDNEIQIRHEVERIEKAYGEPIPDEVKLELTKPSFVSEVSFWQPTSLVPNQNEAAGDPFDEIFQRASSLYGKPIPADLVKHIRSSVRAKQLVEELSTPSQSRLVKKGNPPKLDTGSDTDSQNDWQVAFYSDLKESDDAVEGILAEASRGRFISDDLKFAIVGAFRIVAATGASTSSQQEECHLKEIMQRAAKSYGKPIDKKLQSVICVSSLASLNVTRHNSLANRPVKKTSQSSQETAVKGSECVSRTICLLATFSIHPTSGVADIFPFSLIISQGSVVDFSYPKQSDRAGIVCSTNERCRLDGEIGEAGCKQMREDISSLPLIAQTQWGDVRCATGDSKRIGPNRYASVHVPFVILAVGPNYYANIGHDSQRQSDALLRAAYRSSLAIARESQLEAVAFSLLSTGNRSAHDHTRSLHIALETLSEFPGYTELKEIHLFAEKSPEAKELETHALHLGLEKQHTRAE